MTWTVVGVVDRRPVQAMVGNGLVFECLAAEIVELKFVEDCLNVVLGELESWHGRLKRC